MLGRSQRIRAVGRFSSSVVVRCGSDCVADATHARFAEVTLRMIHWAMCAAGEKN